MSLVTTAGAVYGGERGASNPGVVQMSEKNVYKILQVLTTIFQSEERFGFGTVLEVEDHSRSVTVVSLHVLFPCTNDEEFGYLGGDNKIYKCVSVFSEAPEQIIVLVQY